MQEIAGLNRALDRLESRIKAHHFVLKEMSYGRAIDGEIEDTALSSGEVETFESLLLRFARRVSGSDPEEKQWEPLHSYCSKNEEKGKGSWTDQNVEYFRWARMWVNKTREYIEYLAGLQAAVGNPRQQGRIDSSERPEDPVPYDFALSFAGEDRKHARDIANLLTNRGFSVFFDEYEKATLWGRNLYSHLSDVYQNRARYCLMFISEHYAQKLWTRREREAAQARAFRESREYILPLRLDDTAIPGIEDTVGYVDFNKTPPEEILELLIQKLDDQA